jgi:protein-tyrosine kinase
MSKNFELLQIVGGDDDLFRTSGRLTDIVAKANGESSPELDEETRDRILRNASLPNIFETCNEPSESTSIAAAERSSGLHEESGRGCLQNSTVAEAFRTSKNLTSPIGSPAAPRGLHQSAAVRRSAQLSGPLAEASGIDEALSKPGDDIPLTRITEPSKPSDPLDTSGAKGSDGAAERAPIIVSAPARKSVSASDHFLRFDELQQRCAAATWKLDPKKNAFCDEASSWACIEQFRTLRSRLYRIREVQPVRTLLVTSTLPGEGKTFVALNLAQAIARLHERRVLLIDSDLRASALHVAMGAPSCPGLADCLQGEADEFSIIQANPRGNLFFIPAGRSVSNPAELLSNSRLQELLDRIAPVFDWIIVDSPPVLPVSDAYVLARLCDGVLFVVRAGSTAYDQVQTASREFRGKKLLGFVLNRVEKQATYGGYSYYGYGQKGSDNS